MISSLILLVLFFGMMGMGVPIAYAMLVTCYVVLHFFNPEVPTIVVPQRIFGGVNNYILLCIPFFMLGGDLMAITPLFDRLIKCANALVGHIKGGLSHITIVVAMFFAGITGAATADTSAVGSVMIPAMVKQGYTKRYSTAVTVVSSVIGVIIPPSNLMVVAALATTQSVAVLLLGGVVPGILAGLSLLAVSLVYAHYFGFPKATPMTWKDRLMAFWEGLPGLGIPFIIMGGILGGMVTPTEAANLSVIYAIVVGPIVARRFPPLDKIYHSMMGVIARLSGVMFCLGSAMVLGWLFAIAGVPDAVGSWITSITTSPIIINAWMLIVYLILGTFLDPLPAILIFTPIFLPLAEQIGMAPAHFAVVMVFGLAIGLATPPVGSCLFVGSAISGLAIEQFAKDLLPFIAAMVVVLFLISYIPELVLWFPSLFMG